jgi:HPt (histidine-containing phosphotransfer) domain-containing protein
MDCPEKDTATQLDLAAALDQLWTKYLPQMVERVAILESAGAALAAGALSLAQRTEASAAAHKLAGAVGSFGLAQGTVLAQEAEIFYSGKAESGPDSAARLKTIAAQLRAIVECRKSASSF